MHAPPTYAANLVMASQRLLHSAVGHVAEVTYACFNGGAADPDVIAATLQATFATDWHAQMDVQASVAECVVYLGDGSDVPLVGVSTAAPTAGTSATNVPPPNIAALFKKNTGLGGRKNRGRMYMPYITDEAGIDEAGRLNGTALTAFQAIADTWLSDLSGADLGMVIGNRTKAIDPDTGKPYVSAYLIGANVESLTIEPFVATQRRRMPRS